MKTTFATISFLMISIVCLSQNLLNNPESVVYDSSNNRYLVSNWEDGNIIQIDNSGQQDPFNQELISTAGLHIVGDTLFVSSNEGVNSGIIGFLLSTGEIIFHVDIPEKILLNDITSDMDGNLYVTDTDAHRIYKVSINDMTYTTFVNAGLGWPNGIIFDSTNNRLLVLNGGLPNKPLIAVSLEDSTISTVVETGYGAIDGLTTDNYENTYFSSWVTDKVYRYDETFTNPPEVVSSGHNNPADIFFNKLNNILAIPNFNSNSIDFIQFSFVIHVPSDQPTIQAGIDNAINGDTVLVAPGTYYENINFKGKNIVVASHYVLDDDLEFINSTIIDGSQAQYADTASCVRIVSGEDSTAVLQGFTIRQGTGTHWIDPQFPTYTWHSGGGIFMFQSSPSIKNNYIINNHVDDDTGVNGASGGGICMYGGNPTIINNVIKNNTALYGAGVVIDYSGCVFKNNIVTQNSGGQDYGGGGFWTIGNGVDPVIIENNTIVDNESELKGGAMYLWSTQLTARNNIIWGNTQSSGNQIFLYDGGNAEITYTDIEGGYTGEGNIDILPQFIDTSFMLAPGSPCIDAGNPDEIYNDQEDLQNPGQPLWPAMGELRNDMGVYGGLGCQIMMGTTTSINDGHIIDFQNNYHFQIAPSPITDHFNIKYFLPESSEVLLRVINIQGQIISILINEYQQAGIHKIEWKLRNIRKSGLPPGVYVCSFIVNEEIKLNRKIVFQSSKK